MSYQMIYSQNNIQASGWDTVWKPRKISGASKYPVIMLHGASTGGATSWEIDGPSFSTMQKMCSVLANNGIPVVSGIMGSNAYANDSVCGTLSTNYVNAALAYVSAVTGCSSAKAHVIGASMGAGTGVRWASLNQSKAASVQGVIPMVSIDRLYKENPNLPGGTASFPGGIATAWGLANRQVTDAVITSGSPTLTSATAAFTVADNGRRITRGYTQTGIPVDTTITYVNATTVTMSKNAGATASGQTILIADPLPMTGTAGADLIGVHAPRLLASAIPTRMFYASDDPYILPADVQSLVTAAGGSIVNLGTGGHANANVMQGETLNGGTDWSDMVTWLKARGA